MLFRSIFENELLIRMKTLNINAASFSQLRLDANDDPAQLVQKICSIVSMRGKMQNPITGSGGTLSGVVEEIDLVLVMILTAGVHKLETRLRTNER